MNKRVGTASLIADGAAERRFLAFAVAGGAALRLLWTAQVHGLDSLPSASEASNVALAVAQGRGIADAYLPGQGASAHLMPLNPALAGGVMALLGPGGTAANLVLLGWALFQSLAAILLFRAMFARLGAEAAVLRWGTALLCLVPVFVPQEMVDYRYWEGGSALCLAAINLLLMLDLDARRSAGWARAAGIAACFALTAFVSPPVALATGLGWAVVALRRLRRAEAVRLGVMTVAALALVIGPWTARNMRELGAPVPLRSNFGLELALANHPAALGDAAPERVFAARMRAIHPTNNPPVWRHVQASGGEVAYARMLGAQARRWIGAHPGEFARLWLRHLRQYFVPQVWQIYFTGWPGLAPLRAGMIGAASLIGLAGLAMMLRRRGYWLVALYIGALALPYAAFQPMPRYSHLTHLPLVFLAVGAVLAGWRYVRRTPGSAR